MPLIKTWLFSQQFIVGSETTSTTLLWTMLYLLHHEDVQARVHWEIEKVGQKTELLHFRLAKLLQNQTACCRIFELFLIPNTYPFAQVIGSDREPSFSDRSSMPFTHAVVTESLRMTSFASLGIPHFTSARTTVGRKGDGEEGGKGFSLPAGTTVINSHPASKRS